MTRELDIDGRLYSGVELHTRHAVMLLIQGEQGNLGCGYFSLAPADKLGDRFAIVTGVKSFSDMLEAKVVAASSAALACGVSSWGNSWLYCTTMQPNPCRRATLAA